VRVKDNKIFATSISLIILVIAVVVVLIASSNNFFVQIPTVYNNANPNAQPIKQSFGSNDYPQIDVGGFPNAVGINELFNMVYVVHPDSNSVSVISAENNTKIADIPVGEGPAAVGIDEASNNVYVVNEYDNTVSVISAENNTKIADIL